MVRLLYNVLFLPAFLLYLPVLIVKLVRRGGVDRSYTERFGLLSADAKAALRAMGEPVWIHACSVGETVAALSFIRRWRERQPDVPLVLSVTTTTGHALAAGKLPEGVRLIYCPIDFWLFVRLTLRAVRPRLLVIFEVEIWPNLIRMAAKTGAPVVLANGRMSDKSSRGYARFRFYFRKLFGTFSLICVQTPADAERVRRIIGDAVPVEVCNTMKFDQIPDADGADKTAVLDAAFGAGKRLVFTAGSTHPGEEEMVCDAFRELSTEYPMLRLVLVPRHHERTAEVEAVLKSRHLPYRLLVPAGESADGEAPVRILVVNTTGELMNFYAASDVVYVGKSLAGNSGGHNIIEPAIFGKAIIHGNRMENFRAVAAVFRDADAAIEVASAPAFTAALRDLLADPASRAELGRRARGVVDASRGSIERTLDLIMPHARGGQPGG